MDGKRPAGRQVLQGKANSAGCSATDLEITLSYKGKKVQAGQGLTAGLAQTNPTATELRGTLGLSPDLPEEHKAKTSHCLPLLEGDAQSMAQRG